jgi:hypothetical protein
VWRDILRGRVDVLSDLLRQILTEEPSKMT